MGQLANVRVIDLGGPAAARVGRHLADHGASVIAVRSKVPATRADAMLDRGKHILRELPTGYADAADVVIGAVLPTLQAGQIGLEAAAFPAGHPFRGRECSDEAVGAAASLGRLPVGAPTVMPWPIPSVVAGLWGAIGVVAALIEREGTGQGRRLHVSRYDSALWASELAALLTIDAPKRWATLQWAGNPFVTSYPTAEGGHLYLHAGLPRHVERLIVELRRVGADRASAKLRKLLGDQGAEAAFGVDSARRASKIREHLASLFLERPAEAWEEQLQGLCVVVCRPAGRWLRELALSTGAAIELDDPCLGTFLQPSCGPILGTPAVPRPWTAEQPRWPQRTSVEGVLGVRFSPLSGLSVLDTSQVIAGPVASRVLAELGASVTHLENPHLTAQWAEAFHSIFAAGKSSVSCDLGGTGGVRRLAELIDSRTDDVVIHNLTAAAAERLRIGEIEAKTVVEIAAYGGEWSHKPGWEQTVQAATGMQWDWGGSRPKLMPVPIHDVCTGLSGALGTLLALRDGGGRVRAELATAASWLQEPIWASGRGQLPSIQRGGTSRTTGPSGFYKLRDGWMFLETSMAFRDLSRVSGLELLATSDDPHGALVAALSSSRSSEWNWPDGVWVFAAPSLREALATRPQQVRALHDPELGAVTEIASPLLETTWLQPAPPRDAPSEQLSVGKVLALQAAYLPSVLAETLG